MSFPSHIRTTEGVVSKTRGRSRAFVFSFLKNAVLRLGLGLGLTLTLNLKITLKQHSFKKRQTPTPAPRFTDNRQDLYVLHTWSSFWHYSRILKFPLVRFACPPKQVHLIRIKVDFLTHGGQFIWQVPICCSPEYISNKTSTDTNPALLRRTIQ